MYKKSTQVLNLILVHFLKHLTAAELKILLVIIRQTYGWIDKSTGYRKSKDRISQSQFVTKTGLCKRIITKALQSLVSKGIIIITDQAGNLLHARLEGKGVAKLFFSFKPAHFIPQSSEKSVPGPAHKSAMDKTNYTKLNETKLRGGSVQSVGEVICQNGNSLKGLCRITVFSYKQIKLRSGAGSPCPNRQFQIFPF